MPTLIASLGASRMRARLVGLLGVLVGCSDALAPEDVAGVYLGAASMQFFAPLPADGYEYRTLADSVVLRRDGSGAQTVVRLQRAVGSRDTSTVRARVPFAYRLDRDVVRVAPAPCEGWCSSPVVVSHDFRVTGAALLTESFGVVVYQRASRATP